MVLTWINFRGVTLGARIQTVFTVAKVGALVALHRARAHRVPAARRGGRQFRTFWGTGDWTLAVVPVFGAAMVGSLFSSDAWNNVTFAAAEVRNPTRNLPRALAIGTALVTLCYLLANVAYLNVLPFHGDPNGADALARGIQYASQDRVGTAAVEVMLGAGGGVVMAVAIMHLDLRLQQRAHSGGAAGVLRDGARPALLRARRPPAPRLPHPGLGLWIQAVWASLLCLSGTYNQLLDYVIFAALVFYFLTTLALFRLRRLQPDLPRPVKAFGYPVVPALYVVSVAVADGGPADREAALHLARAADRGAGDPGVLRVAEEPGLGRCFTPSGPA